MKTTNELLSLNRVKELIQQNRILVLAGYEELLKELPKGKWIGGTIPYFMAENGGEFSKEKIFVTDFTDHVKNLKVEFYQTDNISNILEHSYANGFNYLLIPGFSKVLDQYALKAQSLDNLYDTPLTGWVTGIDLNDINQRNPKVFDGSTGKFSDNEALIMHIELPENKLASIEIINIFDQGEGDEISFDKDGFICDYCYVNGKKQLFADYLKQNNIDIRFPLVADYSGAKINISFQEVNEEKKEVRLYAPVREGVVYKLAKPVSDYSQTFQERIQCDDQQIISSCNCILNYLYGELEGKSTGCMKGAITFGEIAYVLVNQTLVYLQVSDAD